MKREKNIFHRFQIRAIGSVAVFFLKGGGGDGTREIPPSNEEYVKECGQKDFHKTYAYFLRYTLCMRRWLVEEKARTGENRTDRNEFTLEHQGSIYLSQYNTLPPKEHFKYEDTHQSSKAVPISQLRRLTSQKGGGL